MSRLDYVGLVACIAIVAVLLVKILWAVRALNNRLASIDYNLMVSAQKLEFISDMSSDLVHLSVIRQRIDTLTDKYGD